MSLLSILGIGASKIKEALKKGAVVIDVRTPHEYDEGHVKNSINIPVDRIAASFERIKHFNKPIIFCCTNGARSGEATRKMKAMGLKEVYNGGSWLELIRIQKKL